MYGVFKNTVLKIKQASKIKMKFEYLDFRLSHSFRRPLKTIVKIKLPISVWSHRFQSFIGGFDVSRLFLCSFTETWMFWTSLFWYLNLSVPLIANWNFIVYIDERSKFWWFCTIFVDWLVSFHSKIKENYKSCILVFNPNDAKEC